MARFKEKKDIITSKVSSKSNQMMKECLMTHTCSKKKRVKSPIRHTGNTNVKMYTCRYIADIFVDIADISVPHLSIKKLG